MIAAVIVTGNHVILDVVAGVALTILAYLLVTRLSLRRRPNAHLGSGSAT
jgi:membrane-associated phospholipid phosphatase